MKALDLAAGLRVVRRGVDGADPQTRQLGLKQHLPPREAPEKTAPLSLSKAAGRPYAPAALKKTWTTSAAFTVLKATESSATRE